MALSDAAGPWLIDKSALVRLARSPDAQQWLERIDRGRVRISTVTLLEVGYSARSGAELRSGDERTVLNAMPIEYLPPRAEDRNTELQTMLADRGQHRAAAIPDLLIAALAELAKLRVLHHDHDYELIAALTAQPLEWLHTND